MGIRRSLITWALSAASVGANVAPTKPASAQVRSSRSHAASSDPRSTDRGRPTPRSRAGNKMSRFGFQTFTLAASANSSSASVTSASTSTDGASTSTASGPQSGFPTGIPRPRNQRTGDVHPDQQVRRHRPGKDEQTRTAKVASVTVGLVRLLHPRLLQPSRR